MKYLTKILFVILFILILGITYSFATSSALETEIENYIKENDMDESSISSSDVINIYQILSEKYTNEEISDMIEEYSEELEEKGLDGNTISTVTTVLDSTSAEALNEFLVTANIDDIKQELDNGATVKDILNKINENMTTTQKVSVISKLLLSNKIIKKFSIIFYIYFIYMILIRGVIYKKAKEHYWATFIPIYRDAVLFRICGYSVWWILLLLIPIIGWILYGILKIIMRFELAKAFDKGFGFGLGLWIFRPIFESILVFSRKTKFIEIEK